MKSDISLLAEYFVSIDQSQECLPGFYRFFVPGPKALQKWPDYPVHAQPEAGRAGCGRGLDEQSCLRSGIGEAVEIASVCCWGDEQVDYASLDALGLGVIHPYALNSFSDWQIESRSDWNTEYATADWCPKAFRSDEPIGWMRAKNASNADDVLVPADAVLIGRRSKGDEDAVSIADTAGCAAGSDVEHAKLSAMLELVERDAVGRWWYGSRQRPRICLDRAGLDPDLLDFITTRQRETFVLDLTSDLEIPCIAAISGEPGGDRVAMGFGAGLDCSQVITHALVEMLQTEIGLIQRARNGDPSLASWIETVTLDFPPIGRGVSTIANPPQSLTTRGPDAIVDRLAEHGLQTYFVDLTRPQFGVPVIRAFVPGLCTDKPRWRSHRLHLRDGRDIPGQRTQSIIGYPTNDFPLLV